MLFYGELRDEADFALEENIKARYSGAGSLVLFCLLTPSGSVVLFEEQFEFLSARPQLAPPIDILFSDS